MRPARRLTIKRIGKHPFSDIAIHEEYGSFDVSLSWIYPYKRYLVVDGQKMVPY